ncbi:MAG: hypothetical protein OEY90_03870, partial [Candidatus Bathyarchaeota archaeon]|nr:hypothetical protein [Candidatus Bathyarchaeota archaeon]
MSRRLHSLASFKQQVMVDVGASSDVNRPIVVETPAILFHILNCFTDILVAVNIYAFPFFQLNLTSSGTSQKLQFL